jgi:ribosomal-protein-alanine N-acetyltransferase
VSVPARRSRGGRVVPFRAGPEMAESGILTAERIDLTPFSDRFLTERYVGWLNDPQTVRYSEQRHRRHSLESCARYAASMQDSPHYFWAIVVRNPDLGHIGNMTATVDSNNKVADLAIMIGEGRCRGQGFGLEAWRRACDFLLRDGGMRKVTAGTMSVNAPMLGIMGAANMIEEGRRARQFLHEGQEVDMVIAALFR